MAHIHLPDGVIPLWAVVLWFAVASLVQAWAVRSVRRRGFDTRNVAFAGMAAAASFAVFQLNVPVLGGVHLSLTSLVGILAGPALGTIVALVVNVLSALLGHGAWGFLGANTVVNATEAVVAYYAFQALLGRDWNLFPAASVATMAGLGVGAVVMGVIPLVSGLTGVGMAGLDLAAYMAAMVALNLGVAVVESLVTGSVVNYLGSVRPDLVTGVLDRQRDSTAEVPA
jgi:cobalt/nickel transport system permease protein